MRTHEEASAALLQAKRQFGRPDAAVLRWNVEIVPSAATYVGPLLVASYAKPDSLVLRIGPMLATACCRVGRPEMRPPLVAGQPPKLVWGLERIDEHTWDVAPSLHQPTLFHAHIVLVNVPVPAPWDTNLTTDRKLIEGG